MCMIELGFHYQHFHLNRTQEQEDQLVDPPLPCGSLAPPIDLGGHYVNLFAKEIERGNRI